MTKLELTQIRALSNTSLLQKTESLVKEERRVGIQILHHVQEISRRRLQIELGFSSIFTYLVEHLKYPESSAYRIVNAMKLIQGLPETEQRVTEQKVEEGRLSIQTLSQIQAYCQAQKKENQIEIHQEEKLEVLTLVEGCSRQEAEKVLASRHPDQPLSTPDRERRISADQTEIKITLNDSLLEKLERVRQLISHKNPNPSYAELLDYLTEITLNQIDPIRKAEKIRKKEEATQASCETSHTSFDASQQTLTEVTALGKFKSVPAAQVHSSSVSQKLNPQKSPRSRYISASDRRQVWVKSGSQCTYVSSITGRRCTEKKSLEPHHQQAFAKGGSNQASNLTLHCKQHNLQEAIRDYSLNKMRAYIKTG